jgi:hypothetical protein
MFSILSFWRRRAAFLARARRSPIKVRRGFRPLVGTLEGRLTPSTLPVTSTADDVNQPGTLRYDVAHAQSGDTILLTGAVQDGIVLTQGELLLNQNVAVRSAGSHVIAISGDGRSRVFEVASGAQVSISQLILTGGDGVASPSSSDPNDGFGGAILVDSGGALTVDHSTLFGNSAAFVGGAIDTLSGTVNVNDSVLSGNSARNGGAITNRFGTLNVNNSILSGNSVIGIGGGGAIFILFGTTTLSNSILSDNAATRGGGAIVNDLGTLAVSNSTLSGNSAGRLGGGAIFSEGGSVTVSNSILSGNTAVGNGGAIFNVGGTVTVGNSTLSDNSAADGGAIFNRGGTVNVGTSTFFGNSPDNIVGGYNDLGGNTGLP